MDQPRCVVDGGKSCGLVAIGGPLVVLHEALHHLLEFPVRCRQALLDLAASFLR